jgi:hypothetical protein
VIDTTTRPVLTTWSVNPNVLAPTDTVRRFPARGAQDWGGFAGRMTACTRDLTHSASNTARPPGRCPGRPAPVRSDARSMARPRSCEAGRKCCRRQGWAWQGGLRKRNNSGEGG